MGSAVDGRQVTGSSVRWGGHHTRLRLWEAAGKGHATGRATARAGAGKGEVRGVGGVGRFRARQEERDEGKIDSRIC